MSGETPSAQTDADRIRLKRLAKLQASSAVAGPSSASSSNQQNTPPKPKARVVVAPAPSIPVSPPTPKPKAATAPFDFRKWENDVVESVFAIALDNSIAEHGHFIWLKSLEEEIISETQDANRPLRPSSDIADRILIARLEIDPNLMSDDTSELTIAAAVPLSQTVLEYLVGCWKRLNTHRLTLLRRGLGQQQLTQASGVLEHLRDLVISYAGLTLQDPTMFPQPNNKIVGTPELLQCLLDISTSASVFASSHNTLLSESELQSFLADIVRRFEQDGLEDILGDLVRSLARHPALAIGMVSTSADVNPNGWRSVVTAFQLLFAIKHIAAMITRMPEWDPEHVKTGSEHEKTSILGGIFRLGVFARDWPNVLNSFFLNFDAMSGRDKESSQVTLRASLQSLRTSLFNIVNSVVRAGSEPREAFLKYVAHSVALNRMRAAMRVKYETQSSDSFIHNLTYILLRLAEPFMDGQYSKLEKIDVRYYDRSSRINIKDITRINATPPEIEEWEGLSDAGGPLPNFISDVFYLLAAVNHLSTGPISQYIDAISRHLRDVKQQLELMEGDESWRGSPGQDQVEAAIKRGKEEVSKMHAIMETIYVALLENDFTMRSLTFANFVSVWLLHLVDPSGSHPRVTLRLPLPEDVPLRFKIQPEYMFDDIVEFWIFLIKYKPTAFEYMGQKEIIEFSMTWLTSTWYITNPYLKSKLVTVLAFGVRPFGRYRQGILGDSLCSHPLSLKHLMMCLMNFYVECEKTGTHTQFYDKFQIRRDISEVMQSVWRDPTHRSVMENFTSNMQEFIKFANRLMNDVTYLLDELLAKLAEIKRLQQEMAHKEEWDALTQEQKDDKTSKLRSAENIVESWTIYSREFLALLIEFTATTRAPFVSAEIVGRLAAMLNYVLDALAGPKCSDLRANDMSKYGFDPKQLLGKVLQIYLNLSSEPAFIQAVASEGRSYSKELFFRVQNIAAKRTVKTLDEIAAFQRFAAKVEEVKLAMEEEDIEDFPDEFQDPVLYTLMSDPVILPSSKVVVDLSTIKSHLLSDPTDPFNRVPLKIEDVVPDVELKAKIEAFVAERRSQAAKIKLASIEDVHSTKTEDTDMH